MISMSLFCGSFQTHAAASAGRTSPPSSLSLLENINAAIETGHKLAEKAFKQYASYMGRFFLEQAVASNNGQLVAQILPYADDWMKRDLIGYILCKKNRSVARAFMNHGVTPQQFLHEAIRVGDTELIDYACSLGAKINGSMEESGSLLTYALYGRNSGQENVLKFLLERGADVDRFGADMIERNDGHRWGMEKGKQQSALMAAAYADRLDLVKLLLDGGADVNLKNDKGQTALHYAMGRDFTGHEIVDRKSEESRMLLVSFLIDRGAHIRTSDAGGWTPLLTAAAQGNLPLMESLLSRGADIREHTNAGYTPLILATGNGCHTIMENLLFMGVDVNEADQSGKTAAMYAIERKDLPALQMLVRHGANLAVQDRCGMTPLMHAVLQLGNRDETARQIILYMLEQKAVVGHINDRTDEGETALTLLFTESFCEGFGDKSLLEPKEAIQVADLLMQRGANLASSRRAGPSVLPSLLAREPELLRYAIAKGVDVNQKDAQGQTILMVLSENYYGMFAEKSGWELFQHVLDQGADPNVVDHRGVSALMYALRTGRKEQADCLLAHGVDLKAVDRSGKTALMHAVGSGRIDIPYLDRLIAMGADPLAVDGQGISLCMYWFDCYFRSDTPENEHRNIRRFMSACKRWGIERKRRDRGGNTLLMHASRRNVECVKVLLEDGEEINAQNNLGETALIQAVESASAPECFDPEEQRKIIKCLLASGADVNRLAHDESTALDRAKVRDVQEILLKAGAKTGETLLGVSNRPFQPAPLPPENEFGF